MALLENHLEQISMSAAAIAELPFPPPKRFTNALLRSHDITALIRDTETHERALFKYAPSGPANLPDQRVPRNSIAYRPKDNSERFPNGSWRSRTRPQHPAVATLLAVELSDRPGHEGVQAGKEREESRFNQLTASIDRYENRVSKQTVQLSKVTRRGGSNEESYTTSPEEPSDILPRNGKPDELRISAEDLEKEEQDVRELERKKQTLEERVSGMERDLGGLLR
ncbi:MAG: hypothetical protein LQ343_001489 [Gyalolechia ehrenbergii]|nr:MAG: hypothetical protein LQ343_001489 [Gyalolechia ehrenbergii]